MNSTKLEKRIEALEQIHNPTQDVALVSEAEFLQMSEAEKSRHRVILIDNIPRTKP